jgi:adenylate kinase family enzyme
MAAPPAPTQPIPERVVLVGCAGSGKTTFAHALAARLDARHIERDALGDDEAPGFATQAAAAVDAAGQRWVFDGAPYNAELLVYPHADTVVALDYPWRVVRRRVLTRSVRLWVTRRAYGAHTSSSPPWRWWAPTHPVGWAAKTHATRHAEIAELFARPELAHTRRVRFTSPRQATAWLASLPR